MDLTNMTTDDLRQLREGIVSDIYNLLRASDNNRLTEKYLKAKEVCELLRCTTGTLFNLRQNGVIRAKKIGGTYYYAANEIDAFFSDDLTPSEN